MSFNKHNPSDFDATNIIRDLSQTLQELKHRIRELESQFAVSAVANTDIYQFLASQVIQGASLEDVSLGGDTTDTSNTTKTGTQTFENTVTIEDEIQLWKSDALKAKLYGGTNAGEVIIDTGDESPATLTKVNATNKLAVDGDFQCVNGVFGASTVTIGDQVIGEDGELVISDAVTPGIKLKDTGDDRGAGALAQLIALDKEGLAIWSLYNNDTTFALNSFLGKMTFGMGIENDQLHITDGTFEPETDNDIDLGTSSKEFKDLFLDGTAHIDTLDVDVAAGFTGQVDFAGGSTYKIEADGDANLKSIYCTHFEAKNTVAAALCTIDGATGADAGLTFEENNVAKGMIFNDASRNEFRFYIYGNDNYAFDTSGTSEVEFAAFDVNFAGGSTYKIESDGDATFKDVSVTNILSASDPQHKIAMDLAANTIGIYPGDEATDAHVDLYSAANDNQNPRIFPSTDDCGYIGTAGNTWRYGHFTYLYCDRVTAGGNNGVTGTFEDNNGNTITVSGGIITDLGV